MMPSINERIELLRASFKSYHIAAFIIPTADPHLSEYTAGYWEVRKWISGFTGSAGTIIVLADKAGLWTDSRYFIQASEQLKDTEITLFKERLSETPTIDEFLIDNLKEGSSVGIDNRLFSASQVQQLKNVLDKRNIHLVNCLHIIDENWKDRPTMPDSKAYIYEEKYAGQSTREKISVIRQQIEKSDADGFLLSALDEIAWTLNIRGNDVHCNPVVISFLLITKENVRLFISPNKLTAEVKSYLTSQGIDTSPYEEVYQQLKEIPQKAILVDADKVNDALFTALGSRAVQKESPVALLKAVRNEQEIKGIHAAMQRDGVAMVQFLKWLSEVVSLGEETELSIDKKLHEFRASKPLYMGESFDTIAGYDKHAAIVHYSATPESNIRIQQKGFLLLDSGAQYLDGTTDITRTIVMGPLSEDEKIDYTLILKGHIDLALSIFPAGTTGGQLDAFARMPIWRQHKNFLHGTGHGVGHFLSVHEGPQSIRMEQNRIPLLPGMIISNEPGIYIEGKHGIRTENLMMVRNDGEGMFGSYLKFETLTLCPISERGIIREMLSQEEINWFNRYHKKVYALLSPELSNDERVWLRKATAEI